MKVCTLASSSKGNCVLVYNDSTKILIDIGITLVELEEKLNILGINPHEITAILNTHEHIDHTKNIGAFMRKYGVPLYCHIDGYDRLIQKLGKVDPSSITRFIDMPFEVGDMVVRAFKLPHDASSCVGYTIADGDKRVSIATDLGHWDDDIISNLIGSRMVILESNHDEKMLLNNPKYSYVLKQRILGKSGHLANKLTAQAILKLVGNGTRQVLLAHLSEENNTPELAYNTVCGYLYNYGIIEGQHIRIDVAPAHDISHVYSFK